MRNITVNAMLNLKEDPISLTVHGSLMTPLADDEVILTKAAPQGINPAILVLDLTIETVGSGSMKMTPKPFFYQMTGKEASQYTQVTIRYRDEYGITVNVEVFG